MHQTIFELIFRLWSQIGSRRRTQFAFLLALMILATLSEMLSIGAVLPFLLILTDPNRLFESLSIYSFMQVIKIKDPGELALLSALFFCMVAIISGVFRLTLLWASARLSYATGADLSINIYKRTLYQPYSVHVSRNSSEIIDGIYTKTSSAIYTISMVVNLIASSLMMIGILIALFYIDYIIAFTAFSIFALIYVFIIRIFRSRLMINSQTIASESTAVVKTLQEGLGGIREVLVDGSQDVYCKIYSNSDLPLRRAQGDNQFINYSPRFIMETLGMLLIVVLAYTLSLKSNGTLMAVPIMGSLALGVQRLLPILQQIYVSWSTIKGNQASLLATLDLLDQPLPDFASKSINKKIPFQQKISFNQISFRYSEDASWVLKEFNLSITKGSRVGIVGATGSGKSTFVDLTMGLLEPTKGAICVDHQPVNSDNKRAWQARIAHVPQVIFLTDSTIEENIAFGVPKDQIDSSRVRLVAQQAQIAESIESWPKKFQTFVGERGLRLSGGQRQRIGIARALYKQADVIIFDEATSALDNETEHEVMRAIEGLSKDLTLIIIAHRLTTLKDCSQIFEFSKGDIKSVGTYKDFLSRSTLVEIPAAGQEY
jgi:ABC-type multidrug transport system fused ATPase/permease subunit